MSLGYTGGKATLDPAVIAANNARRMQALTTRERWLLAGAALAAAAFWFALVWLLAGLLGRVFSDWPVENRLATAAACVILAYFIGFLIRTARLAWLRGHAVELGPKQYPDLHVRLRQAAKRLQIEPAPQVYLYHAHQARTGLSLRRLKQQVVALNADVIGVLTVRPGAIDFFFGYELAWLRDPVTRFWFWLAPALVLPIIGPANIRAAVYRADRGGFTVCRHPEDAEHALATLAGRRSKPFNLAPFTAQRHHSQDFWMAMMEYASARPWLPYRLERLRASAGLADPPRPRHPWAWLGALFLPAIQANSPRKQFGRALLFLAWFPVVGAVWLEASHVARDDSAQGSAMVSRVRSPSPANAERSPAVTAAPEATAPIRPELDAYARVNADLRYLGTLAEASSRKQGNIVCELGKLENLRSFLQLSHARYAFNCGEPVVFTVVEAGEFEPGSPSFLLSYDWKEKRFLTRAGVPPPAMGGP